MRVYEFSKKTGIPTRELLDLLHKEGYEVSSHMAVLEQKALDFLTKKFEKKSEPAPQKAPAHQVQQTAPKAAPKESAKESIPAKNQAAPAKIPHKQPSPAPQEKVQAPNISKQESSPMIEQQKQEQHVSNIPSAPIEIGPMTVGAFADATHQPVTSVILALLKWGIVSAKNRLLTEDVVARLAAHYQIPTIKPVEKKKEEVQKGKVTVSEGEFKERPPVVVVVGHVDHGKTSLLDYIRKTRVAAREKGGITQHLGAYEATTPQGNIIFIDTPGHEAFSKMRMRGVKVADLAILVVAADDGVMPQTVEAIKHIRAMDVPMIAAINKVDKVEPSRIEQVKQELSRHDVLPEEWGGQVVVAPISAKTGQGIDHLLEMIILQAQLMELKAEVSGPAQGYVLESKIEKGRGPVATLLTQHGKVAVGDYFVAGSTVGRVNSLVDSHGSRVTSVDPSVPVLVAGFSTLPEAGDFFEVVTKDHYLKAKSSSGEIQKAVPAQAFAKENAINLIIKTDTNSSKEALLGSIAKISKGFDKQFNIVHAGIGPVSESDIALAATTGAAIFSLHVKAAPNVPAIAQKEGVTLEFFDIIYKLLERLEEVAEGAKEIEYVKEKIGEAEVRRVFDIKGLGVIAGCYVKDGRFTRDSQLVIWRAGRKIGEGPIKSLQRDKKVVKEVHAGYECAFIIDGYTDWAEGDTVQAFIEVPKIEKK